MAFSKSFRVILATLIGCTTMAHAQQTVSPSNGTIQSSSHYLLTIPSSQSSVSLVGILNAPVQEDNPTTAVANGPIFLANASNYLGIAASNIVMISCDPSAYVGFVSVDTVFDQARQASANAVVLYSTTSSHCALSSNISTTTKVYSTIYSQDPGYLFPYIKSNPIADIYSKGSSNNPTTTDPNAGNNSNNPLGPSPSTNVAMIILYAITGLITLLFMSIIVTGAVRAHRHPERYGLRGGAGRPRQSRVRGIGAAILDSLPIVKFGEREDRTKPTDIEMAGEPHGPVEVLASGSGSSADSAGVAAVAGAHTGSAKSPPPQANEITEVTAPDASASSSSQGCSICTDDFEVGQDQRVLPCDHRFHPACIDPWLLNVSGTCPLCRIDLRPSSASVAGSDDGRQDGGDLAPPLEGAGGARTIGRRSTLLSLIGNNRASSMTREQRLVALREHRRHSLYRRSRSDVTNDEAADVEEESNVRRRLRNAFRIRTRRIGEDDEGRTDVESTSAAVRQAPTSSAERSRSR